MNLVLFENFRSNNFKPGENFKTYDEALDFLKTTDYWETPNGYEIGVDDEDKKKLKEALDAVIGSI